MYTGIRCQLKITNLKDQLYLDRIIYTDALVTFNDINKCQNDVILVFSESIYMYLNKMHKKLRCFNLG